VYFVTGRPSTSTDIENLLFPNSMLREALLRKIQSPSLHVCHKVALPTRIQANMRVLLDLLRIE